MIQIGIDTSVLIGLLDPKDIWHEPAMTLKQALQAHDASVAVFDCVLAEAVSVMSRRVHEQRRAIDLEQLVAQLLADYPMEDILWVFPDVPTLYAEIIEMVRSSDGALNFNDALIALSCRYRDIPLLASFDSDFDQIAWLRRIAQSGDLD